jgi:hypothetical protein
VRVNINKAGLHSGDEEEVEEVKEEAAEQPLGIDAVTQLFKSNAKAVSEAVATAYEGGDMAGTPTQPTQAMDALKGALNAPKEWEAFLAWVKGEADWEEFEELAEAAGVENPEAFAGWLHAVKHDYEDTAE